MKAFPFLVAMVSLVAAPVALAQENVEAPEAPKVTKKSDEASALRMTLKLRRDMTLEGSPVELETIKMNTIFGEAKLPLNTIAGIRFPSAEGGDGNTTVILRNGDSLTGSLVLDKIKFVSIWGEAMINTSSLQSVTLVDGMDWTATTTTMGNQRWALSPAGVPASSSSNTSSRVIRSNYIQPSN